MVLSIRMAVPETAGHGAGCHSRAQAQHGHGVGSAASGGNHAYAGLAGHPRCRRSAGVRRSPASDACGNKSLISLFAKLGKDRPPPHPLQKQILAH